MTSQPPGDFGRHQPVPPSSSPAGSPTRPAPGPGGSAAPPPYQPAPPVPAGAAGAVVPSGPVGKIRGTGVSMLLFIVTLGIYGYFWWYLVHAEMRRHRGGIGLEGGIAVVIAIFIAPVLAFLTANEVGQMRAQAGREPRVSAVTGLWYFPGSFIIVGPIVWFVKVNGAINDYWRSLGAV